MRYPALRLLLILPSLLAVATAWPYPTSLNITPTADVLEQGQGRLELEWDVDTSASAGSTLGAYLQAGLTDRLEVGLDVLDLTRRADWQLNLKWLVCPEGASAPAVAVGLMDAGEGLLDNAYLMLSRQMGQFRAHGGLSWTAGTQGLFGLEYYWDEQTGVVTDWTTGPEGYATLGLWRDFGGGVQGTAYYARGNTRDLGDFIGVDVYTEFGW
ncbi:MAG: YjbH domain-containing protein [Armatimonadetes bacterium]|nr:YjbH domain-containing protein [Armatimonadota bacterium]